LLDWTARPQGRGVYVGVQAEWIDWSMATAKEVGLMRKDMFQPAPRGQKPIQVRTLKSR